MPDNEVNKPDTGPASMKLVVFMVHNEEIKAKLQLKMLTSARKKKDLTL